MSQSEPEQQRRPRYAIADDGTLRRVYDPDPAAPTAETPAAAASTSGTRGLPGPPRPPSPRPPAGPGRALARGVAIGGAVALLAGVGAVVTVKLGGASAGSVLTGVASATPPARAGVPAARPTATPAVATAAAATGHATLTGPADALPVDRAAFVRDFRTDFAALAAGRSDENLLAEADALCVGLRYPLSWNDLVAQVRTRYGARADGAGVLSLIASHLCPPDY